MDGLLIVNKPKGLSSRAAVDRVAEWFPGAKLGHGGTLDPLASGVLVIGIGRANRLLEYVQRMRKTYRAVIKLGAASDTDDAGGRIEPWPDPRIPDERQLRAVVGRFVGEIEQVPPAHSAAHVAGKRAYRLARQGQRVELAPRRVQVYGIAILRFAYPHLELEIECGKGTYIRALARDIGRELGCGGYLLELERTRVGSFAVEDAVSLEADVTTAEDRVLPMPSAVAELPAITLPEASLHSLCLGQRIVWSESLGVEPAEVAVFDPSGKLAVIAEWQPAEQRLAPRKVLRAREP